MKQKLFKILFPVAEIITVYWAVTNILDKYYSSGLIVSIPPDIDYHIAPVWAYFLSAALILYLIRRLENKLIK
jgi:hypothetical protein